MSAVWVRAPDHLGDGVQALPAVAALGARAVGGPSWVEVLYRAQDVRLVQRPPRTATAVLLKPSFSAAWQARGAQRRIGLATDGRWPLLTTAVAPSGRHRGEDYAAIVRATVGEVDISLPSFPVSEAERVAARERVQPRTVLLLPGTASPKTARWTGFSALGDALRASRRVLAAGGPGDADAVARAGREGALPALPLPEVAALAVETVAGGGAVVGNDSGLSHLAAAAVRAAGLDVAAVHVVYGSTDPTRTGPPGATAWPGERPACWPCYAKHCPFAGPLGAPCLHAPWTAIVEALDRPGHGD